MRTLLTIKNSTSAERKFAERLKSLHIPFRHRVKINNREVDFVIGKYAIEINGHEQDTNKNEMLAKENYIPLHLSNNEVETFQIKNICH